ncbi:MAG: ATP-binding protein [Geobacteraceae bacterium]
MRVNIRWKLMGAFLLVILLMGGVLYFYLSHTLENYLVMETEKGLSHEARLARLMAGKEVKDMRRDAPYLASTIFRETGTRVTIISSQGEVMGDSAIKPDKLRELENHLGRPEVQEALKSGRGSSIRYSSTIETPMLYVAYPFNSVGGEAGIIRLAFPLTALEKAKASLHSILGFSLLMAMLVSLVLSFILSHVTSRSLRDLAASAARIGKGEYKRRVTVESRDEIGELAEVMNDMAIRIEGQLASISAEKNRLDAILRGMGEGVMLTDASGVITLVNPAFLELFSLEKEEAEGRPLIHITRHPSLHAAFRSVVETKNERLEEMTLPLNGEKTALTHWVPLLEGGETNGVVAVFHDISDLKRLEKVRKDFVANVSHELRTPVTVIKGYTETLRSDLIRTDPECALRFIGIIHNHAERLANLISDLLILSELESGAMSLKMGAESIEAAAQRACALLEMKAGDKRITMELSGTRKAPPVLADSKRIEQVLINLIDNAIKYTPENGTITISAHEEGDMLAIEVKDTGIGIPPNDLPRLFERFYRVDSARSREQGGTGLGLSIVKHIVQLHGGTVAVESTPGKGSIFSFTLRKAYC